MASERLVDGSSSLDPVPCVLVFPLQILTNVKPVSISVTTHKPVSTSWDGTSVWTRTDARTLMYKCLRSELTPNESLCVLTHKHTPSHKHSQLLKYVLTITSEYN